MKRFLRCLGLLSVLLAVAFAHANPILDGLINELIFSPAGWALEVHSHGQNLDGWKLSSGSGIAVFKSGIALVGNYVILDTSSLLAPLAINPSGDTVAISPPTGYGMVLRFGSDENADVPAPSPGQSICMQEQEGFFYIDATPTLGSPNGSAGAMGTIAGVVEDASSHIVLPGVLIWHTYTYDTTDAAGLFTLREYARPVYLTFSLAGYVSKSVVVRVDPGANIVVNVSLESVGDVPDAKTPEGFMVYQNYPNPFNPSTTIGFHLPSVSHVHADLYDATGRHVVVLRHGVFPPGDYTSTWDGTDKAGIRTASGVYVALFKVTDLLKRVEHTRAIKVLLLR